MSYYGTTHEEKVLMNAFAGGMIVIIGLMIIGVYAAMCQNPAASDAQKSTEAVPINVILRDGVSLLSELDGIDLLIPLSEKEIRLQTLKDEALAIVKEFDSREKELVLKEKLLATKVAASRKELSSKKASLERREKIPAMAKGWYRMEEQLPPKGRSILFYSHEFANCSYKVMSYLGTDNSGINFQISVALNDIQRLTSPRGSEINIYWVYLEDFDGRKRK